MSQNKDGENHRSLWQGEWNHLLAFILCRIMSCLEQQLLLHALSLTKHVVPNLYELDQQWQCLPRLKNHLWWWQYPFVSMYGGRKGGKSLSIHQLHCLTQGTMVKHIMGCNMFIHTGNIANGYSNHWWYDHIERCVTIRCGILKRIRNIVKKWVEDKRNEGVLGRINNQASTIGHAQEWRRVCATPKGTFVRSEGNSCSRNWSIKKDRIWK